MTYIRRWRNHDSHRRDGIWRDFLHWIFRYFLQIFRGLVLLNYTENLEKSKKSSGEPPVETAPRNCRFLSLVVVGRALTRLLLDINARNKSKCMTWFLGWLYYEARNGYTNKSETIPKDPAVLKTLRDSELLRCSVFTTPPPRIHYAAGPSLGGAMSAIPRKMVSAQGAPR